MAVIEEDAKGKEECERETMRHSHVEGCAENQGFEISRTKEEHMLLFGG